MSAAYPERPRVAVGAIVFKEDSVLLVKRAYPPSQGKWAIPGGSIELGETLEEAARREIMEETGVDIRVLKPVYTFDYIETDPAGGFRFHFVIIDMEAEYVSGEPAASDDAEDAGWITRDMMDELDVSSRTRRILRELYDF